MSHTFLSNNLSLRQLDMIAEGNFNMSPSQNLLILPDPAMAVVQVPHLLPLSLQTLQIFNRLCRFIRFDVTMSANLDDKNEITLTCGEKRIRIILDSSYTSFNPICIFTAILTFSEYSEGERVYVYQFDGKLLEKEPCMNILAGLA